MSARQPLQHLGMRQTRRATPLSSRLSLDALAMETVLSVRQPPRPWACSKQTGDTIVIQALNGRPGDVDSAVRKAASTASGPAAEKGETLVIQDLTGRLGDADGDAHKAASTALGYAAEKGATPSLSRLS